MTDKQLFIQFPHPGGEHQPAGDRMEWNRGGHKRKFLRTHGQFETEGGAIQDGDVAFWGEWEPDSVVLSRWPADGRLPTVLHEPILDPPTDGEWRQNTDPLVFGDTFIYSNCRQARNRKLRELAAGSVILFGSGQGHGFVLDTLFVVADAPARRYQVGDKNVIPHRPELTPLIFEPMGAGNAGPPQHCRVYEGATHDRPVNGMYSFFPCRPLADPEIRFERPVLKLNGLINPNSRMSAREMAVPLEKFTDQWRQIRDQILNIGLALGVHADLPGPEPRG